MVESFDIVAVGAGPTGEAVTGRIDLAESLKRGDAMISNVDD
ncbi:MAG: hypothetical protein O3B95_06610 [Chloroflexi bacterium]|nr:hypothetical protein [Chloroflexota bacterium]